MRLGLSNQGWRRFMPVTCATCGYLAVRHRDTRLLLDAEERLRTHGEIPAVDSRGLIYEEWPLCFVRAINFREQMPDGTGTPARKTILNKFRECAGHTEWQPGMSPREHLEMNLLKEQRAAEQARREQEQEWHRLRDKEDRQFRDSQAERERQWRNEDTRWRWLELIVMGGIVTAVSVAVQLAAAFISRTP